MFSGTEVDWEWQACVVHHSPNSNITISASRGTWTNRQLSANWGVAPPLPVTRTSTFEPLVALAISVSGVNAWVTQRLNTYSSATPLGHTPPGHTPLGHTPLGHTTGSHTTGTHTTGSHTTGSRTTGSHTTGSHHWVTQHGDTHHGVTHHWVTPVGHTPQEHTPLGHTPLGHTTGSHTTGHTPRGHTAHHWVTPLGHTTGSRESCFKRCTAQQPIACPARVCAVQ